MATSETKKARPRKRKRDIAEEYVPVRELTREEARELFDREARRVLGISGEEFLRRWDAGEYAEGPERPGVAHLAMLNPLVRECSTGPQGLATPTTESKTRQRKRKRDIAEDIAEEYVPVRELTREEAHEILDRKARKAVGISGEEFLRRWDAGEYPDWDDDPALRDLVMLIPLGR